MKIQFAFLLMLISSLALAQTRTHPGGPDPVDLRRCPDAVARADEFHVVYLKANKKNYKPAKEEGQRSMDFEKFIGVQSLKIDLKKANSGSLSECQPAPAAGENEKTLTQLISIYEGNKDCLDFHLKDQVIKQMKDILDHERRN